jgi:adenylate cyclase
MKRILSLFILTCSSYLTCFAQDRHRIDSLQNSLKEFEAHKNELGYKVTPLIDSTKANLFYSFSDAYAESNLDSAKSYAQKCLTISEKIGYKKGIGNGYNNLAFIARIKNELQQQLDYHKKALKIRTETGDKEGAGASASALGEIYTGQGNYPEALNYDLLSLKLYEEIGRKAEISNQYNNIGFVYSQLGDYPSAIQFYLKGLKIQEEIQDKHGIGYSNLNIGWTYCREGNYAEALKNESASLKMGIEIKDTNLISSSYLNSGTIYQKEGNYSEALKNYFNALNAYGTLKNNDPDIYNGIGSIYEQQGNLSEALKYETKGLSLALKSGDKEKSIDAYEELARINSERKDYKSAYTNEILFKQQYDTIYNKDNAKKLVGMQMQYDFDKIRDSTKADQGKKDALTGKEIEDQKRIRNYVIVGLGIVLFFLVFVFFQRNKIAKEKKRSDELLLNILPEEVAEELKEKGSAEAKTFDSVTVIFTDFKGFTTIAENLSAKELVAEIDYCFKGFDNIMHKYGIEKIKTIGDSYMAVGGLPVPNKTHAKNVVNAAIEIVKFMEAHKQQRIKEGKLIFEIRIGINTGHVVAGIVGLKKFAYDIWGDTVNLASRMESSGEPGKVNISGSTYELVKNDFTCTHRGKIQAKNKGEVDMYFVS